MKRKYLYGASVQGIQSFIFETNKLKEIIGASEIVEKICTTLYRDIIELNDKDILLSAAGNIKLRLPEEQCKKLYLEFPKKVMEYAPGITINQAAIELDDSKSFVDQLELLDKKLRTKRNKGMRPSYVGYMGIERCRRTGNVGVKKLNDEVLCQSLLQKINSNSGNDIGDFTILKKIADEGFIDVNQATKQIDDLKIGDNSFIAVIHADGNGLGNLIQNLKIQLYEKDNEVVFSVLKQFSNTLDEATAMAAREAFKKASKCNEYVLEKFPIRPVVLGGDDLTVIIQANMALEFTQVFLEKFNKYTADLFKQIDVIKDLEQTQNGLTACAGIAFVKAKFPLHYALNLSEQLCKEAKNKSNRQGLALSFYKVFDSHVKSLQEMRRRTGIVKSEDYKPYTITSNYPDLEKLINIKDLKITLNALQDNSDLTSKGTSKLRQWISELTKDKNAANFMLDRIKNVNEKFYNSLGTDDIQIIYDAMLIHDLK